MATKDFLLAGGFVSPGEVDIALQRSYATPGSHVSRISCQPFGCYQHHKFCARSLPPSLLLFGRGCHAGVNGYGLSKYIHWGWQKTSKSFFTALPEGFKFQWHRQLKRLKGYVNHEDGLALDWQWLPSPLIENAIDGQNECTNNVEIVEDNDDVEDQFLEERFDQFAMAMAFNDDEMAEKALQEMGSPLELNQMKHLMKGMTEIEKQLHQLYEEMNRMIEEGDQATANDMIEAKYKAVKGQFESGIQGMEQAAMLDMLAQLRMSLGEAEEVARLLSETKEVVDKFGSDSAQPLLDSVLEHMGSMYTSLGKPEEALPYYQRSLKIQEELHGQDSPLIVKVLLGLATTYSDMNDNSHAIEVYNRVLSILEKIRGSDDEALVMPLSRLGHSLLEEGRVDEAKLCLVRALRLAEQLFGEYDGRVGVATCALARVKAAQGEVDESVSLYHKGLQIMEECSKFADKEPTMEAVRSDLAELLNLLGRSEEAQELWEENLRVKERIVGSDDPQLVVHLQNLATSYAASGKHDKCEPLLQHSLKLVTSSFGPNSPQLSIPLECLATTLHHLDRDDEAEPLARQALKLRECSFGSNSPTVGEACNCLASILHSLGRNEEAATLMWQVLAIQEKELGPDSSEIGLTLELLIMLLDSLGKTSEITPLVHRLQKLASQQGGS